MIHQNVMNLELPIIQAPMAGVQDSALTIAVCNAGALGSLPCAMLSSQQLIRELENIRSQTDKAFNLNFFCHQPPRADSVREAAWRTALTPYYRELGIDPASISPGPGREPFSSETARLIAPYAPAFVSFHFGLPTAALLEQVKPWGAQVISSATTVAEARWLQDNGADIIIAQGLEAGGHRGMFLTDQESTQVGTMALLPQVIAATHLPVIAAGGIADATGVAAALQLGAAAVQAGTCYLLCPEAKTSPLHRAALQSEQAQHTALTRLFTGRPARGIVNRIIRELEPISPAPPAFPLAASALMPLRSEAEARGLDDFSPLWCGQNASGCREIPAAELTRQLAEIQCG